MISSNIYTPIKAALIFSCITFILYLWGPYNFPAVNRIELFLFLTACNMAMYTGFSSGVKHYRKPNRVFAFSSSKIINILFIIAIIISVPKFLLYTHFTSNPLTQTILAVQMFFSGSANDLYITRQDYGNVSGIWVFINYAVVLFGAFHWMYIPLSMFFWKKLSKVKKIGSLIIYLFFVLQYICTGTNVGLFEFILSIFVVRIARNIYDHKKEKKINKKKVVALVLLVLIAVLFAFDFVMQSRIGDKTDYVPLGNADAYLDINSPLYIITPNAIKSVLCYATRYVSLPYYALEKSFEVPFNTTFGFGYSWFLLDNIPGSSFLWNRTYMMQMESMFHYNHWSSWHTAYLWFANDVSHFGVPFVLFFIYRIFGRSWISFLNTGNIASFLMFMLFVKMSVFISANNQVFQASDHLFAFWIIYLLSKRYQFILK